MSREKIILPEERLIQAFHNLDGPSTLLGGQPYTELIEPELPTGFPDLVLLCPPLQIVKREANPLSTGHLRLLHLIYSRRVVLPKTLALRSNTSIALVERRLNDLAGNDLLTFDGRKVARRPRQFAFPVQQIVSIEAKISNWQKALVQAAGNRWFASESYILIPLFKKRTMDEIVLQAGNLGVGVISHSKEKLTIFLRPKKGKLPASYGSWMTVLLQLSSRRGVRSQDV